MEASAGKKSTTTLSLFMEAFGLEVEEDLSTLATQCWAEEVWIGKWLHEQKRSLDETGSRSLNVETGERSGDVRNQRYFGHPVAALAHLDF